MPAGAVRPASIDPPLRDCSVEVSRPNAGPTGVPPAITSASLSTVTLR
jgi:hypothetical protein